MNGQVRAILVGCTVGLVAVTVGFCSVPVRAENDFYLLVRPDHDGAGVWFDPSSSASRSAIKQIVMRTAGRYGVPAHVADYHARRESGYRAAARNPKSTAKGVLQVVKGTHEAIIGRRLTLQEHLQLMSDPKHGAAVGMAHIAACFEARPNWTAGQLWQRGHVAGLRSCGTTLDRAAEIYAQRS